MKTKLITAILATIMMVGTAFADDLPSYYSKGMQRTGSLDGIDHQRQMIVIDDVRYIMSSNLIVHSPNAYSIPATQLRLNSKVGYKLSSNGRLIMELWVLPRGYKERGR